MDPVLDLVIAAVFTLVGFTAWRMRGLREAVEQIERAETPPTNVIRFPKGAA